jgi:hypothetical protein
MWRIQFRRRSEIKDLADSGYLTIRQVDEVLNSTMDALETFEKDVHRSGKTATGVFSRFNDVGVVRISFSIVDDKFNERRLSKQGKNTKIENFSVKDKALIKQA